MEMMATHFVQPELNYDYVTIGTMNILNNLKVNKLRAKAADLCIGFHSLIQVEYSKNTQTGKMSKTRYNSE